MPRRPEETLLYEVVAQELETSLERQQERDRLVMFMTISPTERTGLNAAIPQPPPPGPAQPQENVVVLSMDRNGVIRINQDEVEPSRLVEHLQNIFKSRNDRTMFLQADSELLFNDVAQLIDAAKGAGVDRLGLMPECRDNCDCGFHRTSSGKPHGVRLTYFNFSENARIIIDFSAALNSLNAGRCGGRIRASVNRSQN